MTDSEMVPGGGSWITRLLTAGGAVRCVMVEATEVADELRKAHALDAKASHIAAECAVATLLVSAHTKGEEKLTLQVGLEQPAARYVGELDPQHRFRGRFSPQILSDNVAVDDLKGLIFAAKHNGEREVYRGVSAVDHESITQALRAHLVDSTQVTAALTVAVSVDTEGVVLFAGGLLVERLPAHAEHAWLEGPEFAARYGDLGDLDARALIEELHKGTLRGDVAQIVSQRPVIWMCSCTRERVVGALLGLGPDELRMMAKEDDGASVDCHFCNATYAVSADELNELAAQLEA